MYDDLNDDIYSKKVFNSIDGETLLEMDLPKTKYVIRDLLPQGLAIIGGSPKVGKSWLMLDWCVRIAKGEKIWNFQSKQGTTLYLSLEDNSSRLQERLLTVTESAPANVHFVTFCCFLDNGLDEQIKNFVVDHPDTVLIVIDTFQMIRGTGSEVSYASDYNAIEIIKRLADELKITILLVHHLRKQGDSDPFNMISGTNGLAAGADTMFVLDKSKRCSSNATLYCSGRDIEDREIELRFDKDSCTWNYVSDSSENPEKMSDERLQNIEKCFKLNYNTNEVNAMPSVLRVNFSGLLKELSLPEYKSLWPIFEAVVNSIQSINELGDSFKGEISIKAIRNQGSFTDVQNAPYCEFIITDNGPGFNEQNYNSFLEAYSSLKVAKGCKGLGRFLWLKAFEKVVIESVYIENNNCYKRQFEFSEDSFITPEENTVKIEKADPYTKVRLVGYRKKYQKNCSISVEPIAKKIIEHCMMYFISDNCPQIVLSDDIDSININDYFEANIKDSLHQDKIEIQEQSFSIYHIQMRDNATRHELHLCASDREVESIDLSKKIHDLNTKLTDTDGNDYYYVGYITGEYLDTNVNSNRTAFYIDKEKSLTNPITKDDLYNAAIKFIELYLGDDLKNVRQKKEDHIQHFVNLKKPQYKFLLNAKPSIIEDIPNGLKDDDLELELHKQSQKWERELKEIGKKIEQETDLVEVQFKHTRKGYY